MIRIVFEDYEGFTEEDMKEYAKKFYPNKTLTAIEYIKGTKVLVLALSQGDN